MIFVEHKMYYRKQLITQGLLQYRSHILLHLPDLEIIVKEKPNETDKYGLRLKHISVVMILKNDGVKFRKFQTSILQTSHGL